jgi:LAO/AO transport system kinase
MDPSSVQFGGSILGDKTRMPNLSFHPKAYVRPSPTKGALGGVTSACSENILLCEAAGYDTVLVETVGLGQNETTIDEVTDVVVLVTSPAGGDSLQGIKKGVMEVADIIVVNKAEEPLTEKARQSKRDLESAIMLNVRRYPEWIPQVLTCSGLKGIGITELWAVITKCSKTLEMRILDKRKKQRIKNCERMLEDLVKRHLKEMTSTEEYIEIRDSLEQNQIIPRVAAVKLLNLLHT